MESERLALFAGEQRRADDTGAGALTLVARCRVASKLPPDLGSAGIALFTRGRSNFDGLHDGGLLVSRVGRGQPTAGEGLSAGVRAGQ